MELRRWNEKSEVVLGFFRMHAISRAKDDPARPAPAPGGVVNQLSCFTRKYQTATPAPASAPCPSSPRELTALGLLARPRARCPVTRQPRVPVLRVRG